MLSTDLGYVPSFLRFFFFFGMSVSLTSTCLKFSITEFFVMKQPCFKTAAHSSLKNEMTVSPIKFSWKHK